MTEPTPVYVGCCPKCRCELVLPAGKRPPDIMGCPTCSASMRVREQS